MKNFTRSEAYARGRLGVGTAAAALGVAIVVRTALGVGLVWQAFPAYLLGVAMVALGIVRWREYLHARGQR